MTPHSRAPQPGRFPTTLRAALLAGMSLLATAPHALAADYPDKPVKIIVPYAPGGSVDVSIRIMAQQLSAQTGKQFIIDNRTGGGGNIGVQAALDAVPDGYTLLAAGPNLSTQQWLVKTVKFDAINSFAYIAQIAIDGSAIGVQGTSPLKTLAELIDFARANPGKLTYGSSGNGTPGQLAMELFKRRAGVEIRHIPYRGGALAITDVLGGQIDMVMVAASQQVQHVKGGRLRALGITTPGRYFDMPNTPAIGETFAGYESVTWLGLAGHAALPAPVVSYVSGEVRRALNDAAVQKRYRDAGLMPQYKSSDELARYVANETRTYERVIKEGNITAD